MSATLPHVPGEHGEPPVPPAKTSLARGPGYYARRGLKALASLQLTVGLFAVGIGLVFFGTLAQIDFGIWTVVDKYFWSWTVDVPFDLFRKFLNVFWKEWYPPGGSAWTGTFPFPAGKLVGALMLTNLLAAHALRFKLSWKRSGVFLIHGGMILLFVGEFVTREFAVEQQMRIDEAGSADFAIDTRNVELAFVDGADPAFDRQITVAQWRLKAAKPGERITHPDLPVDVEVLKFMKNSDLLDVARFETESGAAGGAFVPSDKGTGPAAYVRIHDKGTKQSLGTFAVSPLVKEQHFAAGPISVRLSMSADGLKVIDGSPATFDRVAVISRSRLKPANAGERLTHPDLSVEIEVVQYMPRAELVEVAPFGKGKVMGNLVLVETGEESGVAMKQRGDATSAYVRLYKKGTDEVTGVYALSAAFKLLLQQSLPVDGTTYQLALRNARYQKPYKIYLDKFRFDKYEGTEKPKNFSSDVRVYAADAPADAAPVREQRIRMNEPLRYAGETFYQADWDKETEKTTILQVVKNPGLINFGLFYATIDYIACAVVTTGLLLHFGIFLIRFLNRARQPRGVLAPVGTPPGEVTLTRIVPWFVLAVMAVSVASVFGRMNPPREPYDLEAFARMPVMDGGRAKPLDTVARVNLRIVSGREEWKDEKGKTQPAILWYLDVISTGGNPRSGINPTGPAWKHKVIRIDNEALLNALGLSPVEGLRYSLEEIAPNVSKIAKAVGDAEKKVKAGGKLDTTEMKYKELVERINTIVQLAGEGGPHLLPPQADGEKWALLGEFRRRVSADAGDAIQKKYNLTDAAIDKMSEEEQKVLRKQLKAELERDEKEGMKANTAAGMWDKLLTAYRDKKPDEFNAAVGEYKTPTLSLTERARVRVEVTFNRFQPFYQCTFLYVVGLVLALVGFFLSVAEKPHWANALRRSATNVLALALVVHVAALFGRMYIMDRPLVFVTNLYSSAVFIGFGCVALCLVLERIFPIGIGNAVAGALGFATCVVAHNLGTEDTLEMMQAVLDTNFWLATHVTTVTLGYTATFVAGFLGAIYVLMVLGTVVRDGYESKGEPTVGALIAFGVAALGLVAIPAFFLWFAAAALEKFEIVHSMVLDGVFVLAGAGAVVYGLVLMILRVSSGGLDAHGKPLLGQVPPLARPVTALALTPESGKILGQMIYGVVAFATLLSFVGTVLGGIWADQSWGRFWGWDPKENGAVLIVLWNALILHARWCGLVKDRGTAVLAVFGNAMTAWSWFGTNQLGVGLHAYGFDTRLADGCFNFWALQLVIVAFGASIPRHFWAGAARRAPVAAASALPVAKIVTPPAATPVAPPATATAAMPSSTPPANGHANGNGHSRRDKGKRQGKRK